MQNFVRRSEARRPLRRYERRRPEVLVSSPQLGRTQTQGPKCFVVQSYLRKVTELHRVTSSFRLHWGLGITQPRTEKTNKQTNSVALSPRANYADWAAATCRRNLVPTFVDRGVLRGQGGGSPTVVNLSFLDRIERKRVPKLRKKNLVRWVRPTLPTSVNKMPG
jgi:hypothetical protein